MMGQSQQLILMAKVVMLGTASFVSLGLGLGWATPAWGNEEVEALGSEGVEELGSNEIASPLPESPAGRLRQHPVTPSRPADLEQPATTVAEWMAQIEAAQVQITGVRLEPTETGLSIVLETAAGDLPTPTTQTVGNALTADIPNAVLALPEGEMFEQFGPAEGIALVSVTETTDGGVQVSITGTDAPPQAQISTQAGNLVLSVVPGVATAADEADEDAIQVVVTATRTEEEIEDIPRSVTVIDREQIEEQSQLTTNLANILGQTVPGLSPPTFSVNNSSFLRGRNPQVLIDGVPINSNLRSSGADFRSIAPGAIERIEVVRGPSAVFGEGATGGVINIITRRPGDEELTATVEARVNSHGDFAEDSFGNYLGFNVSGNVSPVDYVFNFSTEGFGSVFDGAGDRIPGSNVLPQNERNINVLGKLGVNIGENQRLQFSVNHLDEAGDVEFITDNSVAADDPDAEKARAVPFDFECIDFDCDRERRFTTLSLNYNHEDIFGSQLRLQGFYRSFFRNTGEPFFDEFSGDFPGSTLGSFIVAGAETERWGGQLEIETPISEAFNLLWGADYSNDENVQPYNILEEEVTPGGDRVLRFSRVVNLAPPHTVESLGLFAQAQWDITPRWLFSGGVRYENISASVDDYTAIAFQPAPIDVEGGSINVDDVVFNLGTVYDLTDELSVFASFSQGFGLPQIADVLRFPADEFRSFEEDLSLSAPQKVNNYELGVRGGWQAVQFSLAGFFNQSDLGTSFILRDDGFSDLVRAPERVYGVEATVDWQPGDTWQLGGLISWSEGESDIDDDDDFEPLGSFRIPPIKITAYVENETLPGWRNRLQALYVGGRDRAFEAGVDLEEIDSYFVLDYISSVDLGPGSIQIGIQNLLDTEYLTARNQVLGFTPFRLAAPGRTISIGYRVNF
ncbi:MAG: TonB-dependent receptor domain-containing protein [Elainellaceae cyanobacterium]